MARRGGLGEQGYYVLFALADGSVRTLTEIYCRLPDELDAGLSTTRAALARALEHGYVREQRERPEWAREGPWYMITPNGQAAAQRRARSLRALTSYVPRDDP